MKRFLMAALAAAGLVAASTANAETLLVNWYLSLQTAPVATWEQDSNPTPYSFTLGASTDVPISSFVNNLGLGPNTDIDYVNASAGIFQFALGESGILVAGPQVYSGSEAAPIFHIGSYDGNLAQLDGTISPITSILTFSNLPTPVPEPSGWTLMLMGVFAVGTFCRYRSTGLAWAKR